MGALEQVETGKQGLIISRNPATGEVLGEVREMDAPEVRAAVERARGAQKVWATRSVKERACSLRRFRAVLVKHSEELCSLIAKESGKTRAEALTMELVTTCDLITYFCKRAPEVLKPHSISLHLLKNRSSYIHYVPRGIVGVISPWNFPFAIPIGETVMALIAGNGVVLKPSEVTPMVALKAKQLYDESGMPPELFQVVTGRGSTGAALVDAGIDYCNFTGSTATGRKIGAACGERLIPCMLELGGKAPAIVCADADVDRTARALVWGGFANQGQVCASVERVYVHSAIYDELCEKIIAETSKLRQGDPCSDGVDAGSMTWEHQVEIVEARIKNAVDAGAQLRSGGKRYGQGLGFEPTVLTDCRSDMEVMKKEIFGPVLPLMKVADEEEAIALANDSNLGLMAYVFTDDRKKGQRIAERIEAGMVMINDCLIVYGAPETPWQGIKQSGIGRTHSDDGLRDLCQSRHVNYDRIALKRELWWYPYSDALYRQTSTLLKWIFR